MKQVKKLFFVAVITVGGCLYTGFVLTNNSHHTETMSIGLKKIDDQHFKIYIEESVEGDFEKSTPGQMPISIYASIIYFLKMQSRNFSNIAKKLQLLKYYGIGQYMIFKEYIKKMMIRFVKAW